MFSAPALAVNVPVWKNLELGDEPGVFYGQVRVNPRSECDPADAKLFLSAVYELLSLGELSEVAKDAPLCSSTCFVSDLLYHPDSETAEIQLPRAAGEPMDAPPRTFVPEVGRVAQVEWEDCSGLHVAAFFAPPRGAPVVPLRHTAVPEARVAACCAVGEASVGAGGAVAAATPSPPAGLRRRLRVASVNLWNINPGPGTFPDRRDRLRHYLLRMLHVGDVSPAAGTAQQPP